MKRSLSIFLCVAMLLSMTPVRAHASAGENTTKSVAEVDSENLLGTDAGSVVTLKETAHDLSVESTEVASGTCGDNLTWKLYQDGFLHIQGSGDMENEPFGEITDKITAVRIEPGCTRIGGNAFENCINLNSITIPDTVESVPYSVWEGCEKLNSAGPIGSGCDYEFGWSQEIPANAFRNLDGLTKVTIPDGVTTLEESLCYDCDALSEVSLPEGLDYIGVAAFRSCDALRTIDIPDTVTTIANSAFRDTPLRNVVVPGNVTSMGYDVFSENLSLTSVVIEDGCTEIGYRAFGGCSNLSKVIVPGTVSSIWAFAWEECDGLTSVGPIGSGCSYEFGWDSEIPEKAFSDMPGLKKVIIPDGVKTLGYDMCDDCDALREVSLPEGLDYIGGHAFYSCDALQEIDIPDTVTTIDDSAFEDCISLKSIVFEGSAPDINSEVFANVTATAYYPSDDSTWTESKRQGYGGTITWVPYNVEVAPGSLKSLTIAYNDDLEKKEKTAQVNWGYPLFHVDARNIENSDPTSFAELVKISSLLSNASYDLSDEGYLQQMLNQLGSENIEIVNSGEWDFSNPAHSISRVEFYQGDLQKNIVIVTIRGSSTHGDWITDFDAWAGDFWNSPKEHPGFSRAKSKIKNEIKAYLSKNEIDASEAKILITGHSYGAAVANLLANSLEDVFDQSNIYAYTFASPNNIVVNPGSVLESLSANNIHNFRNAWDPVVRLPVALNPLEKYTIFGKQHFFKLEEIGDNSEGVDIFGNHNCTHYVNYAFNLVEHVCVNLDAPVVRASNNAATGKINLTWDAIDGTVEYEVYRATSKNGTYKLMKTTTGTSYTNTSSQVGEKYYYYVVAEKANGLKSDSSNIVSRTCDLPRPVVSATNVASSGKIKLTWDAIDGAEEYKVYRATSKNGTYKLMKTTTGTSYTNTSAEAGTAYYYKVVAVHDNSAANSASSEVKSRTCDLARPEITLTNVASSGKIKVSWEKVAGAKEYKVYRATSKNGTYKLMKTTTGTSYTNTSAEAGTAYYYKVVAVHANSAANSAYSEVKSRTCDLARPVVSVKLNTSGKPVVSWKAVDGAEKYKVYAYNSNGDLIKSTSVTGTKMTHSAAAKGKTYTYSVVAVHSNTAANSAKSTAVSIKSK